MHVDNDVDVAPWGLTEARLLHSEVSVHVAGQGLLIKQEVVADDVERQPRPPMRNGVV